MRSAADPKAETRRRFPIGRATHRTLFITTNRPQGARSGLYHGHYSAKGNAVVAEIMLRELREIAAGEEGT